jgi:Protein of unknown function (DUF2442)
MSTLELDVGDLKPRAVEFTATELVVTLVDGRKIVTPLAWYPRLLGASAAQRAQYELMAMGIHWPLIDEDLSICSTMIQVGALTDDKAIYEVDVVAVLPPA